MIGRTQKYHVQCGKNTEQTSFPKLQPVSHELILHYHPHLWDVGHPIFDPWLIPNLRHVLSQLRPVQFSQPKKNWALPADPKLQIHHPDWTIHLFRTIFQAFSKHFPTIFQAFSIHFKSPPVGWLGDPRDRSDSSPFPRLCRSPRVSWASCFRCFLKSRSWRVWRGGGWKDGGSPETIRKCGFHHDLTMI